LTDATTSPLAVAAPARVLVVGLRVTGVALVQYFAARGRAGGAVDDRPDSPTFEAARAAADALGAEVITAPDHAALTDIVARVDLVVPSPGIPPEHGVFGAARAAGVPVRSEIDIAAELAAKAGRPILAAVTGTNGKTTVTTLATAMLVASGVRAGAAGNVGRALIEAVTDPSLDVIVAEVSSFQLEFATVFHPRVAALLNLADDHLDWHGSTDAYANAKARVFEHQTADDTAVYFADDARVAAIAATVVSRRVGFRAPTGERGGANGDDASIDATYHVRAGELVDPHGEPIIAVADLAARLPNDIVNALAASAVAFSLGAQRAAVRETLENFARLPHRLELVGEANGVQFYDDSKATNPHATVAALRSFDHAVLIAGGVNKGLDLNVLRAAVDRVRAVVAIGDAAPEVIAAFTGYVPVDEAPTMADAVAAAARSAEPGDVVLLSPACASFDWYANYAERGADFARVVGDLVVAGASS
jgi:UDP-N-acetylmuramoylalanine--D-glutamate ligase